MRTEPIHNPSKHYLFRDKISFERVGGSFVITEGVGGTSTTVSRIDTARKLSKFLRRYLMRHPFVNLHHMPASLDVRPVLYRAGDVPAVMYQTVLAEVASAKAFGPIRYRVADNFKPGMEFKELLQLVFPKAFYPTAMRIPSGGGAPSCTQSLTVAMRRCGYEQVDRKVYQKRLAGGVMRSTVPAEPNPLRLDIPGARKVLTTMLATLKADGHALLAYRAQLKLERLLATSLETP